MFDLKQVKEVVIRPAGKAVDLFPPGIVAHRGVPVGMVRVQAAEPLPQGNALSLQIGGKVGAQCVEIVRHGVLLSIQRDFSGIL